MESVTNTSDLTLTGRHLLQAEQNELLDKNIRLGELSVRQNFDVRQYTADTIGRLNHSKTDEYILAICLSGNSRVTMNHLHFQATAGSFHLLVPQSSIRYENASADLNLFIVRFKMDFLEEGLFRGGMLDNLLAIDHDQAPVFTPADTAFLNVYQLFRKLEHEFLSHKVFHNQMLRLLLVELLYEVNRSCDDCTQRTVVHTNRPQQLLNSFKKLIETHFLTLRTVQEYADLLFVSAKHLSEVIKHETGLAPLHHIHNRIFKEASYWLCSSQLSVKEIADKLNFDTGSHFSRFFKNYSGHNPTDFQRIQCEVL